MNRTTYRPLTLLIGGLLLAGCSQTTYRGHGEYFELAHRNIVERDLSAPRQQPVITPVVEKSTKNKTIITKVQAPSNNKPLSLVESAIAAQAKVAPEVKTASIKKATSKTIKPAKKQARSITPLKVWPRERYIDAMSRWLHDDGFNNIAWELPAAVMTQLNQKPEQLITLPSQYRQAVSKLTKTLNVKMYLHVRYYPEKLAALVPWEGDSTLMMARGDNLEMALKTLSTNYNWKWIARNQQGQSYRAKNNYPFPAPYPIATPKGDISQALGKILAPYPVIANLLDNTRTVLIMDEK